jgi:SulP family sulfate permease
MWVAANRRKAMSEQHEPISVQDRPLDDGRSAPSEAESRAISASRNGLRDTVAGLIASVVLIANIVSFGALMFPGELSAGIPTAIWAMLIGGCIGGICIALTTSLPPLATGIDSPTGAVLVLLSAAAGADVVATGDTAELAIQTVMLIFTAATVLTGGLLLGLGALGWGVYFRFVPYFVVGGFLAATGVFLIVGGVRMTAGTQDLSSLAEKWNGEETAKLACAIAALALLMALRRWVKSAFTMPVALVAMWLAGVIVLQKFGLSDSEHGWYFRSLGTLTRWSPLAAARTTPFTWQTIADLLPELLAVTIVALISLVTKVSSIEVARQTSGDLDREFRAHGIGSLVAAPFGGLTSSLQVGTSRLHEQAGGATRMSGVVCSLALGLVGLANFDLPGLIPKPIIAGLVFYLGCTFIIDALKRPYVQRAWLDLLFALAIMVVCLVEGYLIGVLAGVVCACMLFAISYARLGVVRRHSSRTNFASYVDRSPDASEYLRDKGDAIQIYWLSGYIFFGSSESVFERIRNDCKKFRPQRVTYVILDFGMVSGADSSAVVSLTKLRDFSNQHGITLVYCALSSRNYQSLKRAGFFGDKSPHQAFADFNLALAWCEERLLAKANLTAKTELTGFEAWLQQELGGAVNAADLMGYLERKDSESSKVLYRQGESADSLDLIAAGDVVVDVVNSDGEALRVRRIAKHTVVGEMGFFRHSMRSATVSSDGPVVLFTLRRANFERLRRERPDLASAFDDFIKRILADRIDLANREIAALEPLITSSRPPATIT